jgi:hypothetical protein
VNRLFRTAGLWAAACGASSLLWGAVPYSPRVFFSDARLTFNFPDGGELDDHFPIGALFHLSAGAGDEAAIFCRISKPLSQTRLSADLPADQLLQLATASVRATGQIIEATNPGQLSAHHAVMLRLQDAQGRRSLTEFFFADERLYAFSLETSGSPDGFRPAFEKWLQSVRIVGPQGTGVLETPSHGGVWIHQTGGLRIEVPDAWLIGLSTDHTLGATIAKGQEHSEMTATVDLGHSGGEIATGEKQDAEQALLKKGYRVLSISEDAFHGLPSLRLEYDGQKDRRYIRGTDLWVATPKGRWLFSMEGDGPFFRSLASDYNVILNDMDFF